MFSSSKKLNSLKQNIFFLGRTYFASDNESQNMFVSQSIFGTLELKMTKVLIIFLVANLKEYILLNINSIHSKLLSCKA